MGCYYEGPIAERTMTREGENESRTKKKLGAKAEENRS